MASINVLKSSRFLKSADVSKPALLTIKSVSQENVAADGAPEELKYCVHFVETDKPLVLNMTNAQIIAQFSRKEDMDDWGGLKIVAYHDPSVSFGGKLVGGIRVRQPKGPLPAPTPTPQAPAPVDDDVPF